MKVLPFLLIATACGPSVPTHLGYPSDVKEVWSKPTAIKLNNDNYSSIDGTVSYPKRKRAHWYVIDLPTDGSLTASVDYDPKTSQTDLGLEILDEGYNIKVKGTNDDDEGQTKKTRTLAEAKKGKNYVHVYTLGKLDEADYTLKVNYTPSPPPPPQKSKYDQFPYTVPNLPGTLASVPPADDTPQHHVASNNTPPPPPPPPQLGPHVKASVLQFHLSGQQVQIDLGKGSDAGVDNGWTGFLVDAKGNTLGSKGEFTVKNVKADSCQGVVAASPDEVNAHPYAVLMAPK